jgi:tripartite ATP-independent transporter DctP family solute receptor
MTMVKVTRRGLMTTSAAAGVSLFATGRARAAPEFSYKFATNLAGDHPLNVRAKEAIERIRQDSGGRLDIQLFPSNQLGSDTDTLSQLRSGGVELFTLSGLILSTLVPVASINGIGFAFPDYPAVWKAMDGDLGAHVRAAIAKTGIIAMDKIWDNGFRHISSSTKPILTPSDLEGFKIRVPVSPLWTSMFKAFGASPIAINANEMYSALQTKIAEGQENPLAAIWTMRIYEVQKSISLTGHMWDGYWLLANGKAWKALPDDLRAMATKHLNASAVDQRADVEKLNTGLQKDLEGKGIEFKTVDKNSFRSKLQQAGFFAEWKSKYGDESWSILEQYTGKIA